MNDYDKAMEAWAKEVRDLLKRIAELEGEVERLKIKDDFHTRRFSIVVKEYDEMAAELDKARAKLGTGGGE